MKSVLSLTLVAVLALTGVAHAETPGLGIYGSAEYLLWWTKDSPAPVPLVTDGLLGSPGTQVLLGGDDIDLGHRNGARFTLGYRIHPDWAVEGTGFFLSTGTESRSIAGSGQPGTRDLLIPFIDPTLAGENVTNLSLAGSYSGSATETLRSKLWGIELNVVKAWPVQGPLRLELLGGLRYIRLGEEYSFATSSPDIRPGPVTVFRTVDVFDTGNDFFGAQVGLRARYDIGNFMAGGGVKVGLGVMRQSLDVAGSLTTNQFTIPTVVTYAGGYFAQPTNIGTHRRDQFAVVPEANVNVGYRLTSWLTVFGGYTFLYASNVLRPGEQIDRTINPTQSPSFGGPVPANLVGEARPRVKLEGSDFWAHGLSVGMALQF